MQSRELQGRLPLIILSIATLAVVWGGHAFAKDKSGQIADRAERQLAAEDYAAAYRSAMKVVAKTPGDPRALFIAGSATLHLGNDREAAELLESAIQADPQFYAEGLHYQLGGINLNAAIRGGDNLPPAERKALLEQSIKHFDDELTHTPNHLGAISARAKSLAQLTKIDPGYRPRLVVAYEAWAAAAPEALETWASLLVLYLQSGRASDAMGVIDRFAAERPDELLAIIVPAFAQLSTKGHVEDARTLLVAAIDRSDPKRASLITKVLDHDPVEQAWLSIVEYLELKPTPEELMLVFGLLAQDLSRSAVGYRMVPETVEPPVSISREQPDYPKLAAEARRQKNVYLVGVIRSDGTVDLLQAITPESFNFGFNEAATQAVRQWRYRPATLDGQPVTVPFFTWVEFKLE